MFAGRWPTKFGIGHHVFGEAAVHRVAGVLLALAERLPAAEAVLAVAAGGVEPGHADPVALLDVLDAAADGGDVADALVAGDERRVRLDRPVALGGVQVGVADARGVDRHLDHAGARLGDRHLVDGQRLAELANDGGFHGLGHIDIPPGCLVLAGRTEPPPRLVAQKKPSFFGL